MFEDISRADAAAPREEKQELLWPRYNCKLFHELRRYVGGNIK
jgi:hypothetical protein